MKCQTFEKAPFCGDRIIFINNNNKTNQSLLTYLSPYSDWAEWITYIISFKSPNNPIK